MSERSPGSAIEIDIPSDERVAIFGRTRSGKTFLARHLTRSLKRFVALDPKGKLDQWGLAPWDRDARELLIAGEPIRTRVPWAPGREPVEYWESILRTVFDAGDCVVYSDETYLLGEGQKYPPALRDIFTAGGELGIGAISVSQRPRFIPPFVISESEHVFVFRLILEDDRKHVASFTDPRLTEPIPRENPHGFMYSNINDLDPIYIAELPSPHGKGWGEIVPEESEEEEPAEEAS